MCGWKLEEEAKDLRMAWIRTGSIVDYGSDWRIFRLVIINLRKTQVILHLYTLCSPEDRDGYHEDPSPFLIRCVDMWE